MKYAIFAILLIVSLPVIAQHKVDFELRSITKYDPNAEEEDTTNLIKPITITITANPTSPITKIATLENYSIGVQVEVLTSHLQNTAHSVLGMAIYKKKPGGLIWEFLSRTDHWPINDVYGELGNVGEQMASVGFKLEENGNDFSFYYHLSIK